MSKALSPSPHLAPYLDVHEDPGQVGGSLGGTEEASGIDPKGAAADQRKGSGERQGRRPIPQQVLQQRTHFLQC